MFTEEPETRVPRRNRRSTLSPFILRKEEILGLLSGPKWRDSRAVVVDLKDVKVLPTKNELTLFSPYLLPKSSKNCGKMSGKRVHKLCITPHLLTSAP